MSPANPAGTFRCAACGGEFATGWSEEEALAELAEKFPGHTPADCAQVCDDCFRAMGFGGDVATVAQEG